LRLSFWPAPLVLDYGWPAATSLSDVLPPMILVVALLGLSAWAFFRHPQAGFAGFSFFLILAPTSSVIPLADPIFEHRMYLPLACLLSVVVIGGYAVVRGLTAKLGGDPVFGRRASLSGKLALSLVVIILGVLTFLRNRDYKTEVSIWEDTITKRPNNARAYDSMGIALSRAGVHQAAIRKHTDAIRLKPDGSIAYYNRGNTYLRAGMFAEAIGDYTVSLRLKREAEPFNNRAICYYQLGLYEKAWADVDTSRLLGLNPHPGFIQLLQQAIGGNR